jgi:hypothetical protein
MRVWAVSDIHTDYAQNLSWVQELADSAGGDCREDVLLVAGDVSDSIDTLEKTLSLLSGAFGHVFFVPGNHGDCMQGPGAPCALPLPACRRHRSIAGVPPYAPPAPSLWLPPPRWSAAVPRAPALCFPLQTCGCVRKRPRRLTRWVSAGVPPRLLLLSETLWQPGLSAEHASAAPAHPPASASKRSIDISIEHICNRHPTHPTPPHRPLNLPRLVPLMCLQKSWSASTRCARVWACAHGPPAWAASGSSPCCLGTMPHGTRSQMCRGQRPSARCSGAAGRPGRAGGRQGDPVQPCCWPPGRTRSTRPCTDRTVAARRKPRSAAVSRQPAPAPAPAHSGCRKRPPLNAPHR